MILVLTNLQFKFDVQWVSSHQWDKLHDGRTDGRMDTTDRPADKHIQSNTPSISRIGLYEN